MPRNPKTANTEPKTGNRKRSDDQQNDPVRSYWCTYKGYHYSYDEHWIYATKGNEEFKLAAFDEHLYKLRMYNDYPILEIDGLRMQLVKDFEHPKSYAQEVVGKLHIKPTDYVLDTCMGLGYIAIEASQKARKVITCEISNAVYTLASWNPESKELFTNKNIEIKREDAFELVKKYANDEFNIIIHDPPRISRAPLLYSRDFYRQLFRILKNEGKLFHYVGSVGVQHGNQIHNQAKKRLEEAGFAYVEYEERYQAVVALKKPVKTHEWKDKSH